MGGVATFGYVSGNPLTYIDPWGLCQMAVWQGGYIKGWVPCPGKQPQPPQPGPGSGGKGGGGKGGGPAQCQKCYDYNIPDVDIPFHREDRLGGTCFTFCAIKAGLGFGAKEGAMQGGGEAWIGERWGHSVARWCGRTVLVGGIILLGSDLNTCRKTCSISTIVLD